MKIKDVEALDQIEVRQANIIFVDIQGVGRKLKLQDEGLGLIIALKTRYPYKRVIAYSAEHQGQVQAFHEGLNVADSRMSKNSHSYEFEFKIEKYSREIFSYDESLARIRELLSEELGEDVELEDLVQKLGKLQKNKDVTIAQIVKVFSLQNASNLASLIQLFLQGQ